MDTEIYQHMNMVIWAVLAASFYCIGSIRGHRKTEDERERTRKEIEGLRIKNAILEKELSRSRGMRRLYVEMLNSANKRADAVQRQTGEGADNVLMFKRELPPELTFTDEDGAALRRGVRGVAKKKITGGRGDI